MGQQWYSFVSQRDAHVLSAHVDWFDGFDFANGLSLWLQCLVKSLVVKRISRHCSSLNKIKSSDTVQPSFCNFIIHCIFHRCIGVLILESDLGDHWKYYYPTDFLLKSPNSQSVWWLSTIEIPGPLTTVKPPMKLRRRDPTVVRGAAWGCCSSKFHDIME